VGPDAERVNIVQNRATQPAPHNAIVVRIVVKLFAILPPLFYLMMPGIVYVAWLYQIVLPATTILLCLTIPIVAMRTFTWLAKPTAASPQTVLLWSTMLLMSAVILGSLLAPERHWPAAYIDRQIVLMLVYPFCLLVITKDARNVYEESVWIYASVWLFLVACVALGTYQSYLHFGRIYLYFRNWELDSTFNYQILGDMVAVVSLLVLARVPRHLKFLFFLVSMAAIALCYSRSAALCFAAAALVIQGADRRSRVLFFVMFAIATAFLFTFLGATTDTLIDQSLLATIADRIDQVIQGTDQSLLGRQEIASEFWQTIERAWLFGEPFYELNGSFGEGGYVHNIGSYLLTYGAPAFLLLLTAIFFVVRNVLCRTQHGQLHLGVAAVLVFSLLSVAFFRSHVWHMLWFALALAASLDTSQKRRGLSSPVRGTT
jgi:hypothetical protein